MFTPMIGISTDSHIQRKGVMIKNCVKCLDFVFKCNFCKPLNRTIETVGNPAEENFPTPKDCPRNKRENWFINIIKKLSGINL